MWLVLYRWVTYTKIDNLSVHQISPKPLPLESWNSHIVHVLPRQRTNSFKKQFYCPFYWKEFSESAPSTKHRPDKHVRKGQGAAIWLINLYYYPHSPLNRGGSEVRVRDWQSSAHGFESRWGRLETFAISFTPLCQCFLKAVGPFLPCAIINRSEVKHLTKGVNVSPVVDSVILPGQLCLLDAD